MAKISIVKGTTSKLVDVFIQDSSVTTGAGLSGLVFNTAGLSAYYYREGAASAVAITLITQTLGTWASGGFIAVPNMAGVYQLGVPNAAFASGANSVVIMLSGATNMAPVLLEVELTAVNNQSATAFITGVNSLSPPVRWDLENIDSSGNVRLAQAFPSNFASQYIDSLGNVRILQAFPTNFSSQNIDVFGNVRIQQAFPTNFELLSIDSSGYVTYRHGLMAVRKNVALANFAFLMVDSSGVPAPSLPVTATRSIDGAAFGACANSPVSVASGVYKIDLAASDLNGDVITFLFTATGADARYVTVLTQA